MIFRRLAMGIGGYHDCENILLIPVRASVKLRAMFRFFIVLISIVWASLMLISWSGATPSAQLESTDVVTTSGLPS